MDIFCLSSKGEAFPNVLIEAMAVGLPCVTTDVGDCAAIVGGSGLVVPRSDASGLAAALLALLSANETDFRALSDLARQRVAEKFSLEHIVSRYRELYDNLVHRKESLE